MSDLVFNEIQFKNFMSFGNIPTKVKLDEPGTTLIVGENLDDGGSSGAGKTTLVSAISYALYDKIPSGVSKDRLINQTNDKKSTSMEVTFTFTTGGKKYRLERRRGAAGGMQLFEDDVDITPASAQAFNEKIEELIGFSYNMFSQVIFFSGNSRPFLDFSVGEQRNLIEELFKVTTLSRKAQACKKRVTQTEKDIAVQKALIEQQKKQNDLHRKHLAEAKARAEAWEAQRNVDLEKLSNDIQRISEIDFDNEEAILAEVETLMAAINPVQSEIRVLENQLNAKKKERFPKKTELALLEAGIAKKQSDLKKYNGELSHLVDAKCPYCLQKFEDAQAKIEEIKKKIKNTEEEIEHDGETIKSLNAEEEAFGNALLEAISALETEISQKQLEIAEMTTAVNEIKSSLTYKTLKDLTTAKSSLTVMQSRLTKLMSETNPHKASIDSLEAEGEVKVDHEGLEALLKLQEHQQFLVKLLMDKNSFIRKNIVSKTIPFLNKRIGYYTEKLLLPHLAMFQPDMSCEISQYGRTLDHGNLSNGEKKRLNLSLCLAFRDVLTYLHSRVNVLFTDEIDGGSLDSNCIDALISLLKHKAWDDDLGIYIISHRPEFDGRCDRNLVVRKERGFSTIITQPDE